MGKYINLIIVAFLLIGCKKEIDLEDQKNPIQNNSNPIVLSRSTINPYSTLNIIKALSSLKRSTYLNPNRIYHYFKFNSKEITGEILKKLESDSSLCIQNFPFADASVYDESNTEGTISSTNKDLINEENIYIVYKENTILNKVFEIEINAKKLDDLYLPEEDDQDLQIQALITSGYTSEKNIASFKLKWPCLFKRPTGRVTYSDQKDGSTRGVPKISVWALVFGIPVHTYSDGGGYYSIPWTFSAGTIIGTHAKNSYANVKPLNTVGTFLETVPQLIKDFIIGSNYVSGWYSSCRMKKSINIHFGSHNQPRYWAQLLDAVYKHYGYTAADNIPHAPSSLTIYAHWSATGGAASAPMLGHIHANPIGLFLNLLTVLFDNNFSSSSPNLFNLFTGLLPDITIRQSNSALPHYSEDLMETTFHELGHASLFNQVGEFYWIGIITNIVVARNSTCGGYGCGNEAQWEKTQLNESWAAFIGKTHHSRFHPNGVAYVILSNQSKGYYPYPLALEDVPYFTNEWINTGIFYDLVDNGLNESNDLLSNYTINQMFQAFTPNTNGFCEWRDEFIFRNSSINTINLDQLMIDQNKWNSNCSN